MQLAVVPKEPWYWLLPLDSLGCVLVLAHWWAWLGTGWLLVRPKGSVPEWLSSCYWIKLGPGAWYQPVWWVWILGKLVVGHDVSQSWFQHISGQCWGPICSRAITCLLQSKQVPGTHASLLLGGAGSWSFWVVQGDLLLPLACWWVRLYPCMAPRARANWLVDRAMSNINKLQGVLQNGAFYHLFPHGRITTSKWLPPASMSPG